MQHFEAQVQRKKQMENNVMILLPTLSVRLIKYMHATKSNEKQIRIFTSKNIIK